MQPAPPSMDDNVRKFEEIGTHPASVHNAIAEALMFLPRIGIERKAARLRYLKSRWTSRVEKIPGYTSTRARILPVVRAGQRRP